MKRRTTPIAAVVAPLALTLIAAGCGAAASGYGTTAAPYGSAGTQTTPAAATPAAEVGTRASGLGRILVDARGRTLYLFARDMGVSSTCDGACAAAWPPLITMGRPQAGPGALPGELGTTRRADGTLEVTYNRHPLYLYAGDAATGDVTRQGLDQFGAKWYVLSPTGAKVDRDG
jgi:predicted lipoprotein with Yx(FWY)xxD motif